MPAIMTAHRLGIHMKRQRNITVRTRQNIPAITTHNKKKNTRVYSAAKRFVLVYLSDLEFFPVIGEKRSGSFVGKFFPHIYYIDLRQTSTEFCSLIQTNN